MQGREGVEGPFGGGNFRDDSHFLPKEAGYNLTAAAWIDYDGDGRPDILLANGFHGLRLYRNNWRQDVHATAVTGPIVGAAPPPPRPGYFSSTLLSAVM